MFIETGIVAGYLASWAVRKAQRLGGRLDDQVDLALDAGLDRLHHVVSEKLADDPVLTDIEAPSSGTRLELESALTRAAQDDEAFSAEVARVLSEIRSAERGTVHVSGGGFADRGGMVLNAGSDINVSQNPRVPGRSRD